MTSLRQSRVRACAAPAPLPRRTSRALSGIALVAPLTLALWAVAAAAQPAETLSFSADPSRPEVQTARGLIRAEQGLAEDDPALAGIEAARLDLNGDGTPEVAAFETVGGCGQLGCALSVWAQSPAGWVPMLRTIARDLRLGEVHNGARDLITNAQRFEFDGQSYVGKEVLQ